MPPEIKFFNPREVNGIIIPYGTVPGLWNNLPNILAYVEAQRHLLSQANRSDQAPAPINGTSPTDHDLPSSNGNEGRSDVSMPRKDTSPRLSVEDFDTLFHYTSNKCLKDYLTRNIQPHDTVTASHEDVFAAGSDTGSIDFIENGIDLPENLKLKGKALRFTSKTNGASAIVSVIHLPLPNKAVCMIHFSADGKGLKKVVDWELEYLGDSIFNTAANWAMQMKNTLSNAHLNVRLGNDRYKEYSAYKELGYDILPDPDDPPLKSLKKSAFRAMIDVTQEHNICHTRPSGASVILTSNGASPRITQVEYEIIKNGNGTESFKRLQNEKARQDSGITTSLEHTLIWHCDKNGTELVHTVAMSTDENAGIVIISYARIQGRLRPIRSYLRINSSSDVDQNVRDYMSDVIKITNELKFTIENGQSLA